MSSPLLSVVIPTFGRPDLLVRAIDSALMASIDGSIEVLVIPNGGDNKWIDVKSRYEADPRVKFITCNIPHGNAARNVGLKNAKGKYIRFLDDDDYLFSKNASMQLVEMIHKDADVSSGMIEIVDKDNKSYGFCSFPTSNDFVAANVKVSGITLPTANIYKRETIRNLWDEAIPKAQDFIFIIDYIIGGEVKWVKYTDKVGVWYQHNNFRVSSGTNKRFFLKWNFERLLFLYEVLFESNRLTKERELRISEGLWRFIEHSYGLDKVICNSYIKKIRMKGLKHNKVGENIIKINFISNIVQKKPLVYIKMKWMIFSIIGGLRDRLNNNRVRRV